MVSKNGESSQIGEKQQARGQGLQKVARQASRSQLSLCLETEGFKALGQGVCGKTRTGAQVLSLKDPSMPLSRCRCPRLDRRTDLAERAALGRDSRGRRQAPACSVQPVGLAPRPQAWLPLVRCPPQLGQGSTSATHPGV